MVGLLPLCATTVTEKWQRDRIPRAMAHLQKRLRRILTKMLDENEFLSPYGIRSLSKFHEQHPFVFHMQGQAYRVDYLPGESDSGMFGGNSNWRGPIWMPVNTMIIRGLLNFYLYYGDNGAGLGASHQTGWTGVVAKTIQLFGLLGAEQALAGGKKAGFVKGAAGAGEK